MSKSTSSKSVFGPYYKGNQLDPFEHTAVIKDDGGPAIFRWHWPRHILEPRMSAYEVAGLVLKYMPDIIPLLSGHPRIQQEFLTMYLLLTVEDEQWKQDNIKINRDGKQIVEEAIQPHTGDVVLGIRELEVGRDIFIPRIASKSADRLLPWIRNVFYGEDDDIIEMSLFANYEHPLGPTYSLSGSSCL